MDYIFRFAYPSWLLILAIIVLIVVLIRFYMHRPVIFGYSLTDYINSMGFGCSSWRLTFLWIVRLAILGGLALLIARPQLVDTKSKMVTEGIDIMLILDVSDSMRLPSDDGLASRIDIAKQEACRFIDKRVNDTIGLVVFGKDALVRCPITYDKKIIHDIVKGVSIGVVNPEGTVIARALLSGANNLKKGKSKTKIAILLTDGAPTPEDINVQIPLELVKKLGIKVYTIGIGLQYSYHPYFGLVRHDSSETKNYLETIARATGGRSFVADNLQDMRAIYDTIDQLERTQYEVPVFTHYKDVYVVGLMSLIAAIIGELCLKTYIWFGI